VASTVGKGMEMHRRGLERETEVWSRPERGLKGRVQVQLIAELDRSTK
jgi:hypothetical protein